MRIVFVLMLLLSYNLRTQTTPSIALTAGSGFLERTVVPEKGPTQSEYTFAPIVLKNEARLREESNSVSSPAKDDSSKLKVIFPMALLIGISLYYISKKNNSNKRSTELAEVTELNFEPEEKEVLKKELWNYIATQPVEEILPDTNANAEPIITTAHLYNCFQGQLSIEQAYHHPNKNETVFLNGAIAPDGKYKIGLLSSIEVVKGKVKDVIF